MAAVGAGDARYTGARLRTSIDDSDVYKVGNSNVHGVPINYVPRPGNAV